MPCIAHPAQSVAASRALIILSVSCVGPLVWHVQTDAKASLIGPWGSSALRPPIRRTLKRVPVKLMHRGATGSVNSLSPLGEREGVRGLRMSIDHRESETPHPTPLPTGEGADRASGDVVHQ